MDFILITQLSNYYQDKPNKENLQDNAFDKSTVIMSPWLEYTAEK